MRQFVDWQLVYCTRIKDIIDKAWGVRAAKHQKKSEKEMHAPPPPEDPNSRESLRIQPFGQDSSRKRYWIVDGEIIYSSPGILTLLIKATMHSKESPRIYLSGNPWKSVCEFKAVSSSREEYIHLLADLKENGPQTNGDEPIKTTKSRPKFEQAHMELVKKLEDDHLPKVDAELTVSYEFPFVKRISINLASYIAESG